jgi:hypothetical protein
MQALIDYLMDQVKGCVAVIDRINELVDLRDREQYNLGSLAKNGAPQKIAALKKRIDAWQKEIDKLHTPFGTTEKEMRSFVYELRQVLNATPIQPPELGHLRAEIERLDLLSNIQKNFPLLGMRTSYDDLLNIRRRLGEMLAYLPAGDSSEGQASALHQPFAVTAPQNKRRHRGPDIETSRNRTELEDKLHSELGTIKLRANKYAELPQLKREFPKFALWKMLSKEEQKQLLTEPFKPVPYARTLVTRNFGLTSSETIKKDRRKLRNAHQ